MILSRKMLKTVGEIRHPCRTPTVVLNHSPVLPLNRTALRALSYRFSMARMMLYFLIVAHKVLCHILSKALSYIRSFIISGGSASDFIKMGMLISLECTCTLFKTRMCAW